MASDNKPLYRKIRVIHDAYRQRYIVQTRFLFKWWELMDFGYDDPVKCSYKTYYREQDKAEKQAIKAADALFASEIVYERQGFTK